VVCRCHPLGGMQTKLKTSRAQPCVAGRKKVIFSMLDAALHCVLTTPARWAKMSKHNRVPGPALVGEEPAGAQCLLFEGLFPGLSGDDPGPGLGCHNNGTVR
jgi:hypothetical protein